MSADIIFGIDFKSRKTDYKVAEGPFDFAAAEAEIAAAIWGAPVIPVDYDPRFWPSDYRPPEKDPA